MSALTTNHAPAVQHPGTGSVRRRSPRGGCETTWNRGRQGTGTFPRSMPGVGLDGTQKRAYESFVDQASAIHSVIRRMSPSTGQKGQCRDPGRRSTGPMRLDPTHGCPRPQDLSSLLLQ